MKATMPGDEHIEPAVLAACHAALDYGVLIGPAIAKHILEKAKAAHPQPSPDAEEAFEQWAKRVAPNHKGYGFAYNAWRAALQYLKSQPSDAEFQSWANAEIAKAADEAVQDAASKLRRSQPSGREGYVLVPVEPTEEMLMKMMAGDRRYDFNKASPDEKEDMRLFYRSLFKEMLAAAPGKE